MKVINLIISQEYFEEIVTPLWEIIHYSNVTTNKVISHVYTRLNGEISTQITSQLRSRVKNGIN